MYTHATIYGLTDPRTSQLRYVGKTTKELRHRLEQHIKRRHGSKTLKNIWIECLIRHDLLPEIFEIEVVPIIDWEEAEMFWIAYFRNIGCRLLNVTDGGEGSHGRKLTAEHKAKIGAASLNHVVTEEMRRKLRLGRLGKIASAVTREKLRVTHLGKRMSEETREKTRIASTGRYHSEETKAKLSMLRKGKKFTDEHKAALKEAWKLRNHEVSDETKAKLRAAQAARRFREHNLPTNT